MRLSPNNDSHKNTQVNTRPSVMPQYHSLTFYKINSNNKILLWNSSTQWFTTIAGMYVKPTQTTTLILSAKIKENKSRCNKYTVCHPIHFRQIFTTLVELICEWDKYCSLVPDMMLRRLQSVIVKISPTTIWS